MAVFKTSWLVYNIEKYEITDKWLFYDFTTFYKFDAGVNIINRRKTVKLYNGHFIILLNVIKIVKQQKVAVLWYILP